MKKYKIKNKEFSILNLGAGQKAHPEMTNIDYSVFLKIAKSSLLKSVLKKTGFLTKERQVILDGFDKDAILHDLSKGIPFPDGSFNVIYHSHLLEHLDRVTARTFIEHCMAKLKPGGTLRVVVPNLRAFVEDYLSAYKAAVDDPGQKRRYDEATYSLLQQMVETETSGTAGQTPLRRMLENLLLGDRRRRGDLHLWMYDEFSLSELLKSIGLQDVEVCQSDTSRIERWSEFGLDINEDGSPYKKRSVYVEGTRPK